jgi:hypothetical protein
MTERRVLYADRRPYVVADSLEELTGPTTGEVELPLRLDWSEQRRYNLDHVRELSLMYERVLNEAMKVQDLRRYVHGPTLRAVWSRMFLPPRLRAAWEGWFPELANVPLTWQRRDP